MVAGYTAVQTETQFGEAIQQARKQTGLSLREVSRRAGIAPASLSAIERGASSPTLATLERILRAMGTDLAEFFATRQESPKTPVFREKDMQPISDANREYTLLLPKRPDIKCQIVRELISPTDKDPDWETHDFDVGGTVLEGGALRLEIAGVGEWELGPHDAFYVSAGKKHRAVNASDVPVRIVTVMIPPMY